MAHGRSSRRDASDITSDPLSDPLFSTPFQIPEPVRLATPPLSSFVDIEDRRRYDPDPLRSALSFFGMQAKIGDLRHEVRQELRGMFRPPRYPVFEDPRKALICARRKIRREIFFAKNLRRKRGRGGGRRNQWSDVYC